MNREILFAGKSIDTGEWVNGYLIKKIDPIYTDIETHYILHQGRDNCGRLDPLMTWTRVDVETVGQSVGLTDKNGVKIFEGDIVKMPAYGGGKRITAVYFKDGKFAVNGSNYKFKDLKPKVLEVIGNIHDNPELLKG